MTEITYQIEFHPECLDAACISKRCHPSRIQEDTRRTSTSAQPAKSNTDYGEGFGEDVEFFEAAFGAVLVSGFATVKYFRIFSKRFGPMPLMARKSSTLLNGPYDFRILRILSAVTGPIPGTS
jgi:hypothetical protein